MLLAFLWVCGESRRNLPNLKPASPPPFLFFFKYKPHPRPSLPWGYPKCGITPFIIHATFCPLEARRNLQSQTHKTSKLRLYANTPLNQRTRARLREQTTQQHPWQAAHLLTDTDTSLGMGMGRRAVSLPPRPCDQDVLLSTTS